MFKYFSVGILYKQYSKTNLGEKFMPRDFGTPWKPFVTVHSFCYFYYYLRTQLAHLHNTLILHAKSHILF